jgi:hypothetical protein
MTNLSLAAQAVLDAMHEVNMDFDGKNATLAAATLRAAADQVLAAQWEGRIPPDTMHKPGITWACDSLYAISAELEGNTTSEIN